MEDKVKKLQQKLRRKTKQYKDIKSLIEDLKEKGLLGAESSTALRQQFGGIADEIFRNELLNKDKDPRGHRYSKEIKAFALTLHYHSPKAYEYAR